MSDKKEHNDRHNHDFLDEYLKRAMEPDSESSTSDQATSNEESQTPSIDVTEPVKAKSSNTKSNTPSTSKEPKAPIRKKRGWYTIVGLAIIILGSSIGYYRYKHSVVKRIILEGNYYTADDDIIRKASFPNDVSPDSVDLFAVIKRIEELPFIKQADVVVLPPAQVKIIVHERVPLALLLDGSKKALIDIDGIIMPQLHDKTPNVPLLYGYNITSVNDTLKESSFHFMSDFLTQLKSHPLSNSTISELAWSKEEGIVAMSNEDGVKLIFGSDKLDLKLSNWESFYAQIIPKVGSSTLKEVDLRYQGQVITR